MPMRPPPTATLLAALAIAVAPSTVLGQHGGSVTASDSTAGARSNSWHVSAQAIPVLTHARNTAEGADLTEGYLSQPLVMGGASLLADHLRLDAALNDEELTMERGDPP